MAWAASAHRAKSSTNSAAGISLPKLVNSGTIRDRAQGNATSKRVYGTTSSTLEKLNVLSGLVKAKAVKAAVSANGKNPTEAQRFLIFRRSEGERSSADQ